MDQFNLKYPKAPKTVAVMLYCYRRKYIVDQKKQKSPPIEKANSFCIVSKFNFDLRLSIFLYTTEHYINIQITTEPSIDLWFGHIMQALQLVLARTLLFSF